MYLIYVDESGVSGFNNSPTRYFVFSGLVVHELSWQVCFERLVLFIRRMKEKFGLKLREEIHSAALINATGVRIFGIHSILFSFKESVIIVLRIWHTREDR